MTKISMRVLTSFIVSVFISLLVQSGTLRADPVRVQYKEGSVHGYLALRSLNGKIIAAGDLIQTVQGNRLTSRLVYHFRDGSIDDDTAVFTQSVYFRLLSDHHIQKGPMFSKPMDVMIRATKGEVTVRYRDKDQEKVETAMLDLPPDLSNGIILDLMKNIPTDSTETKISYVVATPKPRLIQLSIKPDGQDTFRSAGLPNKANRFKIHVELGGITGVVAPLIGKEPPDTQVWVSAGQVPAFIRSEEPLYEGGPILSTELISPVWRRTLDAK